jgi:predicted metal-dependent hydrolase
MSDNAEWVLARQQKLKEWQRTHKTSYSYTKEEKAELRKKASAVLFPRTEQLAKQYGFTYLKLAVKDMHSRWGSCSAVNKLNYSIYLATLSDELIDYVILHELCHTVHKNHGPQFWALLDKLTQGKAKILSKQLR